MLRHPMELETFVEARLEDARSYCNQQRTASPSRKDSSLLHQARHAIGVALIATGDLIAGDDTLQDRASAKESRLFSA